MRIKVMEACFGPKGLARCTDVISFDAALQQLKNSELPNAPKDFIDYFERRTIGLLRDNVTAGRAGWTNNNCESINHVLKQSIQWRSQQLPELISTLRGLVTGQFTEADRAMCGRGDFALVSSLSSHRITIEN